MATRISVFSVIRSRRETRSRMRARARCESSTYWSSRTRVSFRVSRANFAVGSSRPPS